MAFSLAVLEALWLMSVAIAALWLLGSKSLADRFPRVFAALVIALVVWVSVVVALATYSPALLHPLSGLTGLGVLVAVWRSRTDYGRSRGWPPGSLSLRASIEALVDREFYRKQAARHGPIFKMAQFHQPVVCVATLASGLQLLRQHQDAMGPSVQRFSRSIPGGFLRYMDDSTHEVYGPLFRQALSAQVIAHSWPVIVETVEHELARAAADGLKVAAGSVAPDGYLDRIVTGAFFRTLFGVTPGTSVFEQVRRAYERLAPEGLSARPTRSSRAALDDLRRLLTDQHQQWLHDGPGATPVCALSELGRLDARMPDATSVDNLIYIHKIGSSNLLSLLRWLLTTLGRRPEWIDRLRAELEAPAANGAPTLVERITMETLRLAQAEYLYRRLRKDVVFEGFTLPRGWLVRICVGESHRSAAAFDDPERFDPDRFLRGDFPRSIYSPFGGDRHACNGVPLTNVVCRALLEQLTRRYEWAVEGREALDRDFRHWSHWRPSSDLRLRLDPIRHPASAASATGPGREAAATA